MDPGTFYTIGGKLILRLQRCNCLLFHKYVIGRDNIHVCEFVTQPFPKQALVFKCLPYKSLENTVGKGKIACNSLEESKFVVLERVNFKIYGLSLDCL